MRPPAKVVVSKTSSSVAKVPLAKAKGVQKAAARFLDVSAKEKPRKKHMKRVIRDDDEDDEDDDDEDDDEEDDEDDEEDEDDEDDEDDEEDEDEEEEEEERRWVLCWRGLRLRACCAGH